MKWKTSHYHGLAGKSHPPIKGRLIDLHIEDILKQSCHNHTSSRDLIVNAATPSKNIRPSIPLKALQPCRALRLPQAAPSANGKMLSFHDMRSNRKVSSSPSGNQQCISHSRSVRSDRRKTRERARILRDVLVLALITLSQKGSLRNWRNSAERNLRLSDTNTRFEYRGYFLQTGTVR